MSIAENIRNLRKKNNLTQKKLAELTGLNEVTIRSYEAGKYEPKRENIYKLRKAFNCNIYELLDNPKDYYPYPSDDDFTAYAMPSQIFAKKVMEKAEEDFIGLLYSLGFEVTKLENNNYEVLSNRYRWCFHTTKDELDYLEKSIMDYALFTTEKYFKNLYDEYRSSKHNKNDTTT